MGIVGNECRMKENGKFSVQFLLSNNLPGSITRITADMASSLAAQGIQVKVMFPLVDWWDFQVFSIARMPPAMRCKQIAKLAYELMIRAPFNKRWCGFKYHDVHEDVEANPFLTVPSARDWQQNSVTVVHCPYHFPHILRTLGVEASPMVSVVHVNLEKAMHSESREVAAWFRRWVACERLLSIPRYADSGEGKDSAERLGIPVQKVIPNGIDLELFHPEKDTSAKNDVVISLYCDQNAQKGLRVGVDALRDLKAVVPQVRLHSIGRVTAAQARVFDRNLGYLHGEAYAEALRNSDIFVYPSLYDGFPAPPLQAMASGSALVTTSVAGVGEYAVNEENALVCDPGNPEVLREQVVRLVRDEALRQRLRINGLVTAKAFGVEQRTQELLEFLTEVYEEWHSGLKPLVKV